jgi:hypothetical protein
MINDDSSIATIRKFTWTRIYGEDKTEENITDGPNLEITEPGWYSVHVDSTLNRETKVLDSRACKVTFEPALPSVNYTADTVIPKDEKYPTYTDEDVNSEGCNELIAVVGNIKPEGYEEYDELLFTEALRYSWMYQTAGGTWRALISEDAGENGFISGPINDTTLKVKNPAGNDNVWTFKFIVKNTLNGKTIETAMDDALTFAIV